MMELKRKTKRLRIRTAQALLEWMPLLDDKIITTDPLHNQREIARTIMGKAVNSSGRSKATEVSCSMLAK